MTEHPVTNHFQNYVALGIGNDYYDLQNMDIVICSRDNNNIDVAHYFLEDKYSQPYEHRSRDISNLCHENMQK